MNDRIPLGIMLGAIAYVLFTLHDAANKWLAQFFPVWQMMMFRSAVVVFFCLAIGRRALIERAIVTPAKLPMLWRGALTFTAWLLYYTAARQMPLAELQTLYFSSPIMTALLAIPLLGEKISRGRWVSLGLGFAGVLMASDPSSVQISWNTAMVLTAACLWGYAVILMRQVSRRESSLLQMLFQNLCFLGVTSVLTAGTFVMPDRFQLTLLIAIGVLGGGGQYLMFEGCRLAPASVMGMVEYTALIWAFVLGYVVFGDMPSLPVSLGAGLIFSAGLLLALNERRVARRG